MFFVYTVSIVIISLLIILFDFYFRKDDGLGTLSVFATVLFAISPFLAIFKVSADHKRLSKKLQESQLFEKQSLEEIKIREMARIHRAALFRNIDAAITKNDYGIVTNDRTKEVVDEFFYSVGIEVDLINRDRAESVLFKEIEMQRQADLESGFDVGRLPSEGHAFEKWVAESLMRFGWEAEVTRGSGDQGIDVIAIKNGKKLGLQCKLYNGPVGNKAIQEAHAGKIFYGVDAGGVITNSVFTSSAKELSRVTGIFMLSPHDLPKLYRKVFESKI